MDFGNNIKFNRTKMLDEAALNHRPRHFMYSFLIMLLVMIVSEVPLLIFQTISTVTLVFKNSEIVELLRSDTATTNEIMEKVNEMILNFPWWYTLLSFFFSGFLIVGALFYCKKFEGRKYTSLGIRKSNYLVEISIGLLIGISIVSLSLLLGMATGSVEVSLNDSILWVRVILVLIGSLIVGAAYEIFFRGYFMASIARDYKAYLAVLFSAFSYAAINGLRNGANILFLVNMFLFGVFIGLYVLKRGNIFGACAIHAAWEFVAKSVFGTEAMSNNLSSIFIVKYKTDMIYANGGQFGIRAGAVSSIVIVVAIAILLIIPANKSELPEYEINNDEFNGSNDNNTDDYDQYNY